MKEAISNRPTEAVTGAALGLAVYGFETQVGITGVIAGAAAVVVAFGPTFVSNCVDAVRRR
jgi:hypothetical protein